MIGLFGFLFHTVFVFRLIHIEAYFAHAVIISKLFDCSFDDDVIFIDGDIFHVVEGNAEHLVAAHGEQLELFGSQVELAVVDSLEGHL